MRLSVTLFAVMLAVNPAHGSLPIQRTGDTCVVLMRAAGWDNTSLRSLLGAMRTSNSIMDWPPVVPSRHARAAATLWCGWRN